MNMKWDSPVESFSSSGTGAPANFTDTYTYDLDGNRLSDVHTGPGDGAGGTTSYIYNGDNELTSESSPVNGTTTFTYDANGSQLTRDELKVTRTALSRPSDFGCCTGENGTGT
jgi:YD repeat-containing protein